jgi:hypothetical protein
MSARINPRNDMQFRRVRLIPHIRKALEAPSDLLNLVAAYKACQTIAPEEFRSMRQFRKFISDHRYQPQQQETL